MKTYFQSKWIVLVCCILFLASLSTQASPPTKPISTDALQSLIRGFIPNDGQVGKDYPFYTLGLQHSTFFSKKGILYSAKVEQTYLGANPNPLLIPALPKKGFINHYRGKNPSLWRRGLPLFNLLTYRNLYPGIDLVFKFKGNKLESEFVVKPGADYQKIIMAYQGISKLKLNQDGSLTLKANAFALTENKPYVYQIVQGEKKEIAGQFKVLADKRVTFDLAPFDHKYPLVIDPAISYSTYLGGDGTDIPYTTIVDSNGSLYLAGSTSSSDFPTQSPAQSTLQTISDGFVAKFSSSGSSLDYATYLGGDGIDIIHDIAIDNAGSAYLTGLTASTDFPADGSTGGSTVDNSLGGSTDAFITKLNEDGTIEFSSYVGGSDDEIGYGIAVDVDGGFYLVGQTESSDLGSSIDSDNPFQSSLSGTSDGFIFAFLPTKMGFFSTYLGGSGAEQAIDIEVDASKNLYVVGHTNSTDFPTQSPIQSSSGGDFDCFITKLNSTGSSLTFSTYLGGAGTDEAKDLALDSSSNLYLTGSTASSDFPTQSPLQSSLSGTTDAYLTVVNAAGTQFTYSSYFGGSGTDVGRGIGIDGSGSIYIMGFTNSTDLTTSSPTQTSNAGGIDVFVAQFNSSLTQILFSTYLGGSSTEGNVTSLDTVGAIAVDSAGSAYVAGTTASTDFPTQSPFQSTKGTGVTFDGFVTKLNLTAPQVSSTSPTGGATGVSINGNVTVTFNDNMDSSTLTSSTFYLDNGITGTVSYDSSTKTATLNPSTKLESSTQYTATLTTDIQDEGDNNLAATYTWVFTTAAKISDASSCNLSKDPLPLVGWETAAQLGLRHPGLEPGSTISGSRITVRDDGLPLYFIENRGQLNPNVHYYVQDHQHQILFSNESIDYYFPQSKGAKFLRQKFIHANPHTVVKSTRMTPAKINYFIGNDPHKWLSNIPTASQIIYEELYPGVDMVLHGTQGMLKSEFVVKPGADYKKIQIAYEGINGLTLSDQGDLVLKQKNQDLRELAPYSYQIIAGNKVIIPSFYQIKGRAYQFGLGSYNPNYPLIIDPALLYGSYLGGSGGESLVKIALDSSGNIYMTGATSSANFPATSGAYLTSRPGSTSIYIAKLNSAGSAMVYGTYLGGTNVDSVSGMAVDSNGAAYLIGLVGSTDFPTTAGAFDTTFSTTIDCYVTKLNAAGSGLDYSTLLGGDNNAETCNNIAVDSSGNAYVVGSTFSSDFPLQNPIDSSLSGSNGFVTKLNSTGSALEYSTFLGGSNILGGFTGALDFAFDIVVDSDGNAYVVGDTAATDFPLASPLQSTLNNSYAGFITKINPAGTSILFSSYLDGNDTDFCRDVAIDSNRNIYVACRTLSLDFHTTTGAFQTTNGGGQDVAIVAIRSDFSDYLFSTYLGGSGTDTAADLEVDSNGNIFVVGSTTSSNFPTDRPYQSAISGAQDGFIAQFTSTGDLDFSTYFGGSASDENISGVALAPNEDKVIWIGGSGSSTDVPTSSSPFQSSSSGSSDAFFAKIDTDSLRVTATDPSSDEVQVSIDSNIRVTFSETLDTSTLSGTTVSISPTVNGTLSYNSSTNVVTFNLDGLLSPSTDYTITLTTGITNTTSNPLSANYSFTFTTDPLLTEGGTAFCQLNKGVVNSHGFLEIILVTLLGLLLYRMSSLRMQGSRNI